MKSFIFDLKPEHGNKIKILLKNDKEQQIEDDFAPYFYIEDINAEKQIKTMPEIEKIEKETKEQDGEKKEYLKVFVKDHGLIIKLREDLREFTPREANIPYVFRYLIDKNLYPMRQYYFETKDGKIKKINNEKQEEVELKVCAFDIEVYNKNGMPDAEKDPIIMMSYVDEKQKEVFYWTKNKSNCSSKGRTDNEKEMLLNFLNKIKKENPDVIIGYNSSGFDFPYIKKRASILGIELDLSKDNSDMILKKGAFSSKADVFGRFHLDAFEGVSFLASIGAMNIPKMDIDSVYKELFGKDKIQIDGNKMWEMWENGGKELETLIQYNTEDSTAAYEIGLNILPLYVEFSRLIGLPIYEVSRMSSSQMVEWLLIREAHHRKMIIPRTTKEEDIKSRLMNPIKGAFVKLPQSGIHEKIVVCDFRSLYPSLIMTYNIDKTTLDCDCCKDSHVSPMGHHFCKKTEGLIPKMLKEVIESRIKVKKEMKKHKLGTTMYKLLYARQWALKIIANSAYGYMAYSRALWYSREAAESVTAWARKYIHETIEEAEKKGFEVLYADTDSVFLKLNDKTREDALEFVESINKKLPEKMELEYNGYYPRGIFVTKKEGGAAKKKYALMREDKTLEIKGFELVRRDWANVAKTAQERVIKLVLEEGNPEKAIEEVKKIIQDLKNGKIKQEDLIIYTQIKRKVDNYEQQAPHVKAAKKLIKAGFKIKVGAMLEFIVVKGSGSISERSIPVQLIENKKYDPDYYIENQVLPAVMKIMHELGVKEDDLKNTGTQEGLNKWF